MVTFKSSVRFKQLTPELFRILEVIMLADQYFVEDMVITSVNDSQHSTNSAHYRDAAVDIRCNDRPYNVDMALVKYLQIELGSKFFVLYEGQGTPNEHIHIQLRKGMQWTQSSLSGESSKAP